MKTSKNEGELNRIQKKLRSIEINENFQEKVRNIRRNELGLPIDGCKTSEEVDKAMFSHSLRNGDLIVSGCDEEANIKNPHWLDELLKEFEIDNFYRNYIETYVCYNDFYKNRMLEEIANKGIKASVYFKDNDDIFYINDDEIRPKKTSSIIIEITAETTMKDIQAIWKKEVKEMQKMLIGYEERQTTSTPKNMNIDRMIYDLYLKKTTRKEIASTIKKEFKVYYMDDEINQRIYRFKKKNKL